MITVLKFYLMTHLSIDYTDHFQWHWTYQRIHSGIIILILFYCVTKDGLVLIILILFSQWINSCNLCNKDMMLLNTT